MKGRYRRLWIYACVGGFLGSFAMMPWGEVWQAVGAGMGAFMFSLIAANREE